MLSNDIRQQNRTLREVRAMKFPGGFNIQQMMKQAQVMQEKMQKEMEELRTEASAGGGVVTVEMKGNHEIVSLKIDPGSCQGRRRRNASGHDPRRHQRSQPQS